MEKNGDIEALEVVAFDWDNTLVESRSSLVFCVNKILSQYGLPDWSQSSKKRDNMLSFRDNFPRIFGDAADEAYQKYRGIYQKEAPKLISVFDGVYDVVNLLKKCGKKLVVVSNKDRLLLELEYGLLFKSNTFEKIVCGHEAPRDKPYPEQLFHALNGIIPKEKINTETVWMVGDSLMDSMCAKSAGVRAIRIGSPIWEGVQEPEDDITFFSNMREFYNYLLEETGENL